MLNAGQSVNRLLCSVSMAEHECRPRSILGTIPLESHDSTSLEKPCSSLQGEEDGEMGPWPNAIIGKWFPTLCVPGPWFLSSYQLTRCDLVTQLTTFSSGSLTFSVL